MRTVDKKLRRAANMLKELPLKKAAKFLEKPVEDFENESPLDSGDTLGWTLDITSAEISKEADRILAMDAILPADPPMESIPGVHSNLF